MNSFQSTILGKYVWAESHEIADYLPWMHPPTPPRDEEYDCIIKTFIHEDGLFPGWEDSNCESDHVSWTEGSGHFHQMHALCELDL